MHGHGYHWTALYGEDEDIATSITRDIEGGTLVDSFACVDVANGTENAETVICLRWGHGAIAEDMLVVTESEKQSNFLFSGYPVLLDGIRHSVTVDHVEPWEHHIEGWIHALVTNEKIPLTFFDTRYYAGSASLQSGQRIDISLAGLAYSLEPMVQHSIEIGEGALWEMERQRRLDRGESLQDASKPVSLILSGMAALLPRTGEACDDAEFRGLIDSIVKLEHGDLTFYRLEIVVLRPNDEAFKIPIFVSERVIGSYIPRLGEDVQGVMWVQGYVLGLTDDTD